MGGDEHMADTAQRPAGPERPWLNLLLLVGGFLALCLATLLLPHDPYIRYQQLLPTIQSGAVWGFERTELRDTAIDIAVVGNSRMQAGVSAPELQGALVAETGRDLHVANLAMPQEGRNAQYVVAKRLLQSHPELDLLIVSVVEQMPREGHPAFRNIADAGDVLDAPVLFNRDYFDDLAYLPYRQLSLFVQSALPRAFGNRRGLDDAGYPGDDFDTTHSFTTATGNYVDRDSYHTAEELLPPARERVQGITPPLLPASAADYEFAVERHYTREIARLAQANGTRVVFLYLPIYNYPLPVQDQAFYEQRGALLAADFLADDARNYSDYGHLNRHGSALLTDWLARQLVERELVPPRTTQAGE